ncbi:MAG: type II secretion system F family protein [Coprobacillus sp.]
MNKEYLFLKNFYELLASGYSIEESLLICNHILHYTPIQSMLDRLKLGDSIENILLESPLPKTFREYFIFFQNKNCLSEAIEKSLNICLSKQDYQNQLKSKLTYPLILFVFLFLFSIFVVFILLPNVNELFNSFGIDKSLFVEVVYKLFYLIPIILIVVCSLVVFLIVRLLLGLKRKSFRVIERYLKYPIFKICLKKYFSLKFAIYYNELLKEEMDSASIIAVLNDQMKQNNLKIVLYEMSNRMNEGEALENILEDFEYLDELFLTFFKMYMKNPKENYSLNQYIDFTYQQIDIWVAQFLKYLVPSIYCFVAVFVITIYISIIIPMMNVISDI